MNVIRYLTLLVLFQLLTVFNVFGTFNTVMSSSTNEIHTFLTNGEGSVNAKLIYSNIFTKDNTIDLCFIDFSQELDTPVVTTIDSAYDAKVPVISPDGKWVVFARGDGVEAGSPVSKRSSVYICKIATDAVPVLIAADSACEPRFMLKADQLTIIYSSLAPNYSWEGIGKTMKISVDTTQYPPVVGTPEVLFEHGGYTGGLSWDKTYLCAGGGDIVMIDITGSAVRPDTLSLFPQSCNSSISSSHIFTNAMMYLTMDGIHPSVNDGKSWQTWQVILINNKKKQLLKGYGYPATPTFPLETNPASLDKAKWHHCEWSNHPYFAAATVNADRYFEISSEYMNTKYQERLYLINLKDSAYIEILRPETVAYNGIPDDVSGLHWPWLWVEVTDNFKEDSTWLISSSEITTNSSGKINAHFSIKNGHLYSEKAISSVSLYQLNGRCIQSISLPQKPKSINLSTFNSVGAGIYFIQVKCPANGLHTFRFIITR